MRAVVTRRAVTTWYPSLRKPAFNPPTLGALTTTLLYELTRRLLPDVPRVDLLGMHALASGLQAAGRPTPGGRPLFALTLSGDLVSNTAYFGLVSASPRGRALLVGLALGVAAGLGEVYLPPYVGAERAVHHADARQCAAHRGPVHGRWPRAAPEQPGTAHGARAALLWPGRATRHRHDSRVGQGIFSPVTSPRLVAPADTLHGGIVRRCSSRTRVTSCSFSHRLVRARCVKTS